MSKERKTYSKEFKQKAVELSNVRGNVQEIARELGIAAEYIYRWRKEPLRSTTSFCPGVKKESP